MVKLVCTSRNLESIREFYPQRGFKRKMFKLAEEIALTVFLCDGFNGFPKTKAQTEALFRLWLHRTVCWLTSALILVFSWELWDSKNTNPFPLISLENVGLAER